MLGIAATTLSVSNPSAAMFVWSVPLAACLAALALILRRLVAMRTPVVRSPA
jgi:hypothetical protein